MAEYPTPYFWLIALGIMMLLFVAGCTALGSSGTSQPLGGESAIFYSDYLATTAVSTTNQEKIANNLNALPTAVLAEPHYVAGNTIYNANGQTLPIGALGVLAPQGYRVAYTTAEGLFVRHLDGSAAVLISSNGRLPRWSADGAQLAYVQGEDIMLSTAAGSDQRPLVHGPNLEPLAFSPDGERLLYGDGQTLVILPTTADGPAVQTELTDSLSLTPQWSADGQAIVVGIERNGTHLDRIDTTTGEQTPLIDWEKPDGVISFALSPIDNRLAFVAEGCQNARGDFGLQYEDCDYMAYVADAEGGNVERLGTVNTTINPVNVDTKPAIHWAAQRPAVSLTASPFTGLDSAAAEHQETNVGLFAPAPMGERVQTANWSLQLLETVTEATAASQIRALYPQANIRSDRYQVGVHVRLTYWGSGSATLQPSQLNPQNGLAYFRGQEFIDPALNRPFQQGQAVEGWLFMSWPLAEKPDPLILIFRPESTDSYFATRLLTIE